MSEWVFGLVGFGLLLGGALLFTLAPAYLLGSGVHAEYPQGVSFTGGGHFFRMTYYGTAWVRDAHDPRPCPLVIHLAGGDMAAAVLADPDALLARGWSRLTDDEQLAAGLPLIVQFRQGDYAVHLSYSNPGGVLTAVTVGFAQRCAPRPDARGIAVSFPGGRVALPASEGDLTRALGPPQRRTRGGG